MRRIMHLTETYAFLGFRPLRALKGRFGDRFARVLLLRRRGKKQSVEPVARFIGPTTTTANV